MNTVAYCWTLLAGLVAAMAVYALHLHAAKMKTVAAVLSLPLCVLLGYALAAGFYAVLQANVRLSVFRYSFIGGSVGVLLGIIVGAILTKQSIASCLDAFAPAFALEVAISRIGEYFMDRVGLGRYTEVAWIKQFPFGITNEWNEWYIAVFSFEAIVAGLIFVVALAIQWKKTLAMTSFLIVVFSLSVCQVLFEQLRTMVMSWGFVRVEQVLCAVILLVTMIYVSFDAVKHGTNKKLCLAAIIVTILMIGLVTAMEFAMDGKIQMRNDLAWFLFVFALIVMLIAFVLVLYSRAKACKRQA